MTNKLLKSVLAGVFLSVTSLANAGLITTNTDSALNGADILTFENEVDGKFSSRLFNNEVTISTTGALLALDSSLAGSYGMQGRSIKNTSGQNYIFDFSTAISAFGWNWGAADQGGWKISLFDNGNQLISSYDIAAQTSANGYANFYGATGVNISRVTLANSTAGDYAMIDNLHYVKSSSVPEPSTLVIFAIGIIGLASRRFKNKS